MTRRLTTVIVLLTCLVRVSGAQQGQKEEQVVTALTTCATFLEQLVLLLKVYYKQDRDFLRKTLRF